MTNPDRVALVTDSTVLFPKELLQRYPVAIVPQILVWGQDSYEDGIDIQPVEFYRRLQNATVMPSTSQVTPKSFIEIFKKLTDEDHDVLAVLIAEKLSGTIASAVQARSMLPPAQAARIEIVDSYTTAMAMGFQVIEAVKAAHQGATLAECKAVAEKARQHVGILLTVDTLEFLYRGGRIGGATRFMGTLLNFKPILELKDSRIEPVERVRTKSKALARMMELLEQRIGGQEPIHLAFIHANDEADALAVKSSANGNMNALESYLSEVSPVIGTHAGPGTVGVCWLAGM